MSIHISSAVWKAPIPNAGAKIVLLALADIANHEGVCWPSNGTLCAMTSLSKTTVKEHLRALAEQGIIDVESGVDFEAERRELIDDDPLQFRHVEAHECGLVSGFENVESVL